MSGSNSSWLNPIIVRDMTIEHHNIIIHLHRSLGLITPSHVTMAHMCEALESGEITSACLHTSLVRSDAYRIAVRSRFRDACYTLLGDDDEEAFWGFDLAMASSNSEAIEVTDEAIMKAVRCCARYEIRYSDIIRRNYSMLMNGDLPSDDFTASMFSRFREDQAFTISDLHSIIRNSQLQGQMQGNVKMLNDVSSTSPDNSLNTSLVPENIPVVDDPVDAINSHIFAPSPVFLDRERLKQILHIGDCEYGRPWYALELMAYMEGCSSFHDRTQLTDHICKLVDKHQSCWEDTRAVYQELLGDSLDEIDFVRKYVGRHQDPAFHEIVRDEILTSEVYEQRIKNRLTIVQKRLYDVLLDADDMKTLFEQAKSKRVGVSDDAVATLLHNHKRECDALMSDVVRVYVDVLSREPDQVELESDLRQFRAFHAIVLSNETCDIASLVAQKIELAVRLSKGFEFHDVVKTRLRSAYHKASGGVHVPMQLLYSMLEGVLRVSEATLRNTDNAHGLIGVVQSQVCKALNETV